MRDAEAGYLTGHARLWGFLVDVSSERLQPCLQHWSQIGSTQQSAQVCMVCFFFVSCSEASIIPGFRLHGKAEQGQGAPYYCGGNYRSGGAGSMRPFALDSSSSSRTRCRGPIGSEGGSETVSPREPPFNDELVARQEITILKADSAALCKRDPNTRGKRGYPA